MLEKSRMLEFVRAEAIEAVQIHAVVWLVQWEIGKVKSIVNAMLMRLRYESYNMCRLDTKI